MSFFNNLGAQPPQAPQAGGFQSMMQRFQQFQQMFKGNPRQQVQNLLNSGKVSQQDYDRAVQMAQQFQKMLGK